MRQIVLSIFVFVSSLFPLIASAGQPLLHPPSREHAWGMKTAPPLEDSPVYSHSSRKRFFINPPSETKRREEIPHVERGFSPDFSPQEKQCRGQFIERGIASWYGPGFHGRTTANGTRYDQNGLTIAHRTLPFGSRVCIRNPQNGREVIATVTDRGPFWWDQKFKEQRKFDLSKRIAENLDLIGPGTGYVEVYRSSTQ